MTAPEDYPLVMIEWEDSKQPTTGWQWLSSATTYDAAVIQSVGWLIHDGGVKALAANLGRAENDGDRQASGIITIPACSVIKITKLDHKSLLFEKPA